MALSSDLVSQFVKMTTDTPEKQTETTAYGTIKVSDGKVYVRIDGSTLDTPISTTTAAKDGDRVTLLIKNHSVVVTGNITSPSINDDSEVENGDGSSTKISELGIVVAEKVNTEQLNAVKADITELSVKELEVREKLTAAEAEIKNLVAEDVKINGQLEAHSGKFDTVDATFVTVTGQLNAANAKIENLEATDADFRNLEADYGSFKNLTTENFTATNGNIDKLTAEKLDATWANIDFAKIEQAVMDQFYASSGLIEHVTMEDGTVTGYLVGVTIRGDYIEGNTIQADKLVIKGEDGLYYKLNFESGMFTDAEEVPTDSIHGSVITAKSITAEKVSVSDLVAFGATIGGFNIGANAIYSGVKASVDNSTRGSYLDKEGQFSFGDSINYIRYYKVVDADGNDVLDEDGNQIYRLAISADSITFGNSGRTAAELADLADRVKIGTYTDPDTGERKPSVELAEDDSTDKLLMTNEKMVFTDGTNEKTKVGKDSVESDTVIVNKELQHGPLAWGFRANGNYGLMWKGAVK